MLYFELKKLLKRTPVWLLLLLTIGSSVGYFFYHVQQKNQRINDLQLAMNQTIHATQEHMNYLLEQGTVEQGQLDNMEYQLTLIEEQLAAINGGPADYLTWFINDTELYAQGHKGFALENRMVPSSLYAKTNEQLRQLQINQIEQMQPLNYLTDFQQFSSLLPEDILFLQQENQRFYEKSWYHLWHALANNHQIVLLLMILLGIFASYAHEQKRTRKHLQFLWLEDYSPIQVLLHNYLAKLFYWSVFSVLVVGAVIGLTAWINGLGDLRYPVPIDTFAPESSTFIPLSSYLLRSLGIYIESSLFALSLGLLIESLLPHPVLAWLTQTIVLISGIFFTPLNRWNPFSYFLTHKILTKNDPFSSTIIRYQDSWILLVFASCFVLSAYLIVKQRMRKKQFL